MYCHKRLHPLQTDTTKCSANNCVIFTSATKIETILTSVPFILKTHIHYKIIQSQGVYHQRNGVPLVIFLIAAYIPSKQKLFYLILCDSVSFNCWQY